MNGRIPPHRRREAPASSSRRPGIASASKPRDKYRTQHSAREPMAAVAVIRLPRPSPALLLAPQAASSTPFPPRRRLRAVRLSVRCRAGGDGESGEGKEQGEESPESLFARELRRRGMEPGAAPSPAGEKQAEEGGAEAGRKRGVAAAAEFERRAAGGGADGQRERSMALNSEGLEGLVPRAKLLLSLGGTFFLAFGPLILVTVSLFAGLYLYFGPSFVHDASKTPISPPPYIDPYELLEDERLTRPSPDVF